MWYHPVNRKKIHTSYFLNPFLDMIRRLSLLTGLKNMHEKVISMYVNASKDA